ncbi:MAG: LamG domain-containing protein, partial [Planctomycetes bacterium]|nr:LamG domain-containing protein [Planctomycetota bacterium]
MMCKKLMVLILIVFVLSLGLPSTTYGQLPGLVGWWKFDGDLRDSSGLNNHGIAGGGPGFVAGHIGSGALDLDGNDWVIIDSVGDDVTSALFSIAVWVKSTQTNQGDIIALNNNGSGHPFELYIAGGGNPGREDGGDINYPNAPTIGDGEWHHLAWVNDGGAAFIYVDGVEAVTYTSALAGEFASVERWSIGQEYDSTGITDPSNFYTGQVDDLQIYNRPLTAEEVVQVLIGIPPGSAFGPTPAHEETDVSRDVILGWEPGESAKTRNVYFGTVFADVNAASPASPMDVLASLGQGATTYDPARLEFGQTYFWRVDEVNAAPDFSVFAGSLWQFTVEQIAYPITAITATASGSVGLSVAENTINGSGLVGDLHGTAVADMWLSDAIPAWIQYDFGRVHRLHELWIWNSNQLIEPLLGFGAKEVVIEHSRNGTDWTVLEGVTELARAPGTEGYAANNRIAFGGAAAQHVRITINSVQGFAAQPSLSEVRFLSVPTLASRPSPASGAADVSPAVPLAWGRDGREAGSHDVYLGTDANSLSLAGSLSESSFDTSAVDLQLSQTYHWRVDEVNDAMDPSTWTGDVWSFTTADAIIIDDMESYRDQEFFEIWATWIDGFGDEANNGALVGADPGTGNFSPETDIVHGGSRSLPIHYDNGAAAQSEATRSFAVSQDWTRAGVSQLVVWFHGAAGNTGQLYLKVNGTKIPYQGAAGNIGLAAWQAWSIDLASLGMNLQRV